MNIKAKPLIVDYWLHSTCYRIQRILLTWGSEVVAICVYTHIKNEKEEADIISSVYLYVRIQTKLCQTEVW